MAVIVVVAINVAISVYLPMFNRAPDTTHAAGESWVVGYTYRRAVTVDNTKVATTSDAFAVLATTTLATLKTTGNGGNVENSNGYDIVWADSDGDTLLNFEVEKYDATTGEVVHWINTDISSTTDKVLYMYYGNDSISTDQSDKNNTWTSDHVGVWHFPDNLTASTTDSTGNNVNGIPAVNASSTDEGQLGGSFSFDAAEGTSLDLGSNTDLRLLGTSYTISLWTRPNVVDLSQHIVSHTDDTNGYSIRPATGGDGDLIFNAENSVINDTPASSFGTIGQWYHIVVAYNSTGTNTQFYIDGVSVDSDSESDLTLPSGNLYLGSRAQNRNTSMYNGNIDEFRILSSALTDADILTQYNNQSANAEFITIASEETANNAPSTPSSAVQYFSTTTRAIANTDYTSAQQIDLGASATDADTSEVINLFFEVQENATAFDSTATPTTGTSCAAGETFADCTNKIWYVTSASGDYSSTAYTATTTVSGLVEDTNYKWQVKACDDGGSCSAWQVYNATTPNFGRDDFYGMSAKRTITVEADNVTANLTNFPMFFSATIEDLKATSSDGRIDRTDAGDIVFTNESGDFLDFEIEKHSPTTGELIAWIEVDSISSTTDTIFNMYYGDSGSVDHATTTGVWTSDYMGVWHLPDNTTASTTDSSVSGNAASVFANASTTSSGYLDGAFAFDGTLDYLDIGDTSASIKTLSFWIKASTDTENIIDLDGGTHTFTYSSGTATAGGFASPTIYVDGVVSSVVDTSWHYLSITTDTGFNASDMDIGRISSNYFDGIIDEVRISSSARSAQYIATSYNNQNSTSTFYTISAETPNNAPATPTRSLQLYSGGANTQISNGGYTDQSSVKLISNVTDADTAEILTVYYEIQATSSSAFNSPATPTVATSCASETLLDNCSNNIYYVTSDIGDYSSTALSASTTVSGIESSTSYVWQVKACDDDGSCSAWQAYNASEPNFSTLQYLGNTYYKEITIDNTKVTSNLTNFPVFFSVTDSDLKATSSSGYMGNLSANDLLFTNSAGDKLYHEIESYDNSTGELNAWINVNSISSTTDTTLYMYYGSSTIPLQASSTATWASDYAGVWHLGDVNDSTSNGNDGTAEGNASSTDTLVYNTGKLDEAFSFDGDNDRILINNPGTIFGDGDMTVSSWVNTSVLNVSQSLVSRYEQFDMLIRASGGDLNLYIYDSTGRVSESGICSGVISQNVWSQVVLTVSGTTALVYADGVQCGTKTITTGMITSSQDIYIGNEIFNGEDTNGTIDEVRILNTAKSAQYITTSYNNQNSTSTFYTIGDQQPNVAPSVPTLVSPADAGGTTDNTPTLSANYTDGDSGDVGTTNYRISSTNASDCTSNANIVDSGTSSETSTNNEDTTYTSSSSIGSDGTYYWCAQNNDGVATSAWTEMGSFTLDTTAPTNIDIGSITIDSSAQITVVALTATDAGVGLHSTPYWFNETTDNDGGTDSSVYQLSTTYIDSGLTPNTEYDYQVKAQDSLGNASGLSSTVASTTVRTLSAIPTSLGGSADSKTAITATWNANSNPSGTNYYIENTTEGTNSGWITDTSWTSSSLTCGTSYDFKIKSRNDDSVETSYTTTASISTSSCNDEEEEDTSTGGGFSLNTIRSLYGDVRDTIKKDVEIEVPPEEVPEVEPVEEIDIIIPEPFEPLSEDIKDVLEAEKEIIDLEQLIIKSPLIANLDIDFNKLAELSEEEYSRLGSLAILYEKLNKLTSQFPSLTDTLAKVNVNLEQPEDINKIKGVEFKLPGFTKNIMALDSINLPELSEILAVSGTIPLSQLPKSAKEKIPEDVIFARSVNEKIDLGIALNVSEDNKLEQSINIIPNQPLTLIVKPENTNQVGNIKGYLVLKSIALDLQVESNGLSYNTDSYFHIPFVSPVLAQDNQINEVNKPEIEDLMVLVEFEYTDEDNDGIYTANFQAPPIAGEYEVITVIEYRGDLDTKVLRLTTVIDPEGYVYTTTKEGETRIENSIVFIYWLNPQTNQYDLWPADKFSQENPQITDQTGKYSFLVPEGTYYLKVESDNYHDFQSTEFVVSSGDSVHQNIELKLIRTWQSIIFSWQVLISLLAIVLIVLAVIIIIKLNKFNK